MPHRMLAVIVMLLIAAGQVALAQSVDNPRVVTVSPDGSGADYSNLHDAISSITTASSSNRFVVLVYPGIYTGSNNGGDLRWKSHVSLRGVDRASTIIRGGDSGAYYYSVPLIDFTDLEDVDVSNITLDGSAQMAIFQEPLSGSIAICGASIRFSRVTLVNSTAGSSPGVTLQSGESNVMPVIDCSGVGNFVIQDSETGPIFDVGGNWTISNSAISGSASDGPYYVFAFYRLLGTYPGSVSILASSLTAEATGSSVGDVAPVYLLGEVEGPEIRIVGSKLVARNFVSSPSSVTTTVYEVPGQTSGSSIFIEGSELRYESSPGASGGEFYGVYSPEDTDAPIHISASSIRSAGSGGTRADVYSEGATRVALAATEHSTASGATGTTPPDVRQGQFSADLIIPLNSPTLVPAAGQIWIDTGTNKICYRSGGTTRCVLGS